MNNTFLSKRIPKSETEIESMGYIQCVTCGKTLGHLYDKAIELRQKNHSELEIYQKLDLRRTCCRYHLSLGFKLPMVKYLDESVRLDLDDGEEGEITDANENSEKVFAIKNRLLKLKDGRKEGPKLSNTKKISFFVAT